MWTNTPSTFFSGATSSPHLSTGQEQEDTDLSNDSKDLYNSEEATVDEANRSRTVMTSDAEVANGFVKNGTSLPYVFETNKSGKINLIRLTSSLNQFQI